MEMYGTLYLNNDLIKASEYFLKAAEVNPEFKSDLRIVDTILKIQNIEERRKQLLKATELKCRHAVYELAKLELDNFGEVSYDTLRGFYINDFKDKECINLWMGIASNPDFLKRIINDKDFYSQSQNYNPIEAEDIYESMLSFNLSVICQCSLSDC